VTGPGRRRLGLQIVCQGAIEHPAYGRVRSESGTFSPLRPSTANAAPALKSLSSHNREQSFHRRLLMLKIGFVGLRMSLRSPWWNIRLFSAQMPS